jgi:hypothetical protein
MDDPRYEVKDAAAQKVLLEIGHVLKRALPPNYGFVLFLAGLGINGNLFYLSSIERASMLEMLKGFIARVEAADSPEEHPVI